MSRITESMHRMSYAITSFYDEHSRYPSTPELVEIIGCSRGGVQAARLKLVNSGHATSDHLGRITSMEKVYPEGFNFEASKKIVKTAPELLCLISTRYLLRPLINV